MPKRLLLACLVIILFKAASAQQFGANRPTHKWLQINTDTIRVIFPGHLTTEGIRVASLLRDVSAQPVNLGNRRGKINIVLQNETLLANGYVQMGPFRSEFYMTPPPNSMDLGAMSWADQLALHEYRHVLQNVNARKGVSKLFSILGGELGQAAITNIALPNWFWEGDAVLTETALSAQGRGRLPSFFAGFRALSRLPQAYSFMKIRNGSLKDYVPNHYELGYIMTSYGQLKYGKEFWGNVMDDAVRYKGVFYPFSQSLKRRTGMNAAAFSRASLDYYEENWKENSKEDNDATMVSPSSKHYEDYQWIQADGEDWIVLKQDFKKIPAFYRLKRNGAEEKLWAPGYNFDNYFYYNRGKIVYTESRNHPRWGYEDYSVIRIYDVATKHLVQLTRKSRYFSPALSSDNQQIVAVESSDDMKTQLVILNAQTGEQVRKLENPDNWVYTYPVFAQNNSVIYTTVRNLSGEMALVEVPVETGQAKIIIPFGTDALGPVRIKGEQLYFTANFKDVTNIYATDLRGENIRQVSHADNYVSSFAVGDNKIRYSEFTAGGNKILEMPLETAFANAESIQLHRSYHGDWLHPKLGRDSSTAVNAAAYSFDIKKYRQTKGFFNLHSWIPTFDDPDYSYTIYGNNVLNTTETAIGYTYNRNEESHKVGGSLTYGGWFPYLTTTADYTFRRNVLVSKQNYLIWNEFKWGGGLGVPINLSSGKFSRGMSLSANYNYVKRNATNDSKYRFNIDQIQYYSLGFSFNNQRMKARQNIFSHFGQTLYVQYNNSLNEAKAAQLFARLDLYLPGFARNHNIVINLAYQDIDTSSTYRFTDNFSYARGYNSPYYDHIYKIGVNYHFPVAYPDWGFANALYFTRIRGNIFYDYSEGTSGSQALKTRYNSVGGELYFDTKLGNALPFTCGLRFSHLLNDDPQDAGLSNKFDFILPLQQLFSY
ncbi:hypothetical protein COR50_12225 [Chitinophaga caeni]|uniref:Uncharacterized protein n=1 Tax=Chitinophaga caeni TaxID=2029983 RepID=A0A291QVA5_9BACT|nr:hypothetical protein [Chitinophaga caeni]ATL47867.1 hypothetical protein COR50_12225 [Chitinophaga caeni]